LLALAGLARLGHQPEEEFMSLFVDKCMAVHFHGFNSADLANVINCEHGVCT
jgi:hypothetical protein